MEMRLVAQAKELSETIPLNSEAIDRHRELNCASYERCLLAAANLHWNSFTCEKCQSKLLFDLEGAR
jgi:hypothetical protein